LPTRDEFLDGIAPARVLDSKITSKILAPHLQAGRGDVDTGRTKALALVNGNWWLTQPAQVNRVAAFENLHPSVGEAKVVGTVYDHLRCTKAHIQPTPYVALSCLQSGYPGLSGARVLLDLCSGKFPAGFGILLGIKGEFDVFQPNPLVRRSGAWNGACG
jgi:hypothetical protein